MKKKIRAMMRKKEAPVVAILTSNKQVISTGNSEVRL